MRSTYISRYPKQLLHVQPRLEHGGAKFIKHNANRKKENVNRENCRQRLETKASQKHKPQYQIRSPLTVLTTKG